jgi:hypothetical protein
MVTRPFEAIENHEVPDEDAIVRRLDTDPAVPWIASFELGVDEPIPILPLEAILNNEIPVDDATLNGLTPDDP